MNPILFYFPVLRALNEGRMIRLIAAMAMRLMAVAAGLMGLYQVVMILKAGFREYAPASITFGSVIAAVLLLVCFYAIAQVFWFRSNSILELEEGPFKVVPIISINLKCMGEVYATFLLTAGVAGCLLTWVADRDLFGSMLGEFLPFGRGLRHLVDNQFLMGLLTLVTMVGLAFTTILVFYFLAELVVVLVDIALGVRRMAPMLGSPLSALPMMAAPGAQSAPQPPRAATSYTHCRTCQEPLDPVSEFCSNCGTKIR